MANKLQALLISKCTVQRSVESEVALDLTPQQKSVLESISAQMGAKGVAADKALSSSLFSRQSVTTTKIEKFVDFVCVLDQVDAIVWSCCTPLLMVLESMMTTGSPIGVIVISREEQVNSRSSTGNAESPVNGGNIGNAGGDNGDGLFNSPARSERSGISSGSSSGSGSGIYSAVGSWSGRSGQSSKHSRAAFITPTRLTRLTRIWIHHYHYHHYHHYHH